MRVGINEHQGPNAMWYPIQVFAFAIDPVRISSQMSSQAFTNVALVVTLENTYVYLKIAHRQYVIGPRLPMRVFGVSRSSDSAGFGQNGLCPRTQLRNSLGPANCNNTSIFHTSHLCPTTPGTCPDSFMPPVWAYQLRQRVRDGSMSR
ncbi:hypothetical protein E4U44_004423 [Claviceps purpurea]|nr:hypothetical protein E4U44_004423 [Claviceps purpurea]